MIPVDLNELLELLEKSTRRKEWKKFLAKASGLQCLTDRFGWHHYERRLTWDILGADFWEIRKG